MRRDMEYRLSLRVGKTVVAHETHRTPVAAAERAEEMRRQAKQGELAHFQALQDDPASDN
jgi:hypothetical protein